MLRLPAAALALVFVPGCAQVPRSDARPCFPPAYSVAPAQARVGERVVVSAPDATCDPQYGLGAQVEVSVVDAAGVEVLRERAPMNDAGGFSFAFNVPPGAAAGPGHVSAYPYGLDWCDDTGTNNRVRRAVSRAAGGTTAGGTTAGGTTAGRPAAVVLASCAVREVPLTVEP